jgi:hypothetical protein
MDTHGVEAESGKAAEGLVGPEDNFGRSCPPGASPAGSTPGRPRGLFFNMTVKSPSGVCQSGRRPRSDTRLEPAVREVEESRCGFIPTISLVEDRRDHVAVVDHDDIARPRDLSGRSATRVAGRRRAPIIAYDSPRTTTCAPIRRPRAADASWAGAAQRPTTASGPGRREPVSGYRVLRSRSSGTECRRCRAPRRWRGGSDG